MPRPLGGGIYITVTNGLKLWFVDCSGSWPDGPELHPHTPFTWPRMIQRMIIPKDTMCHVVSQACMVKVATTLTQAASLD